MGFGQLTFAGSSVESVDCLLSVIVLGIDDSPSSYGMVRHSLPRVNETANDTGKTTTKVTTAWRKYITETRRQQARTKE